MLKIIIYTISLLIFLILLLYLFQRHLIYHPARSNITPKQAGLANAQSIQLKTKDGIAIQAWYHPAKPPEKITILYLHGNTGHLGHRVGRIKAYLNAGLGVMLLSYRGYGASEGKPSEQGLYHDARAALNFLTAQKISTKCIVLLGESLGTGVATQMATESPIGAVILQSPYTSIVDVAKKHYFFFPANLLLHDRYESITKVARINAPTLLIHGLDDRLIPAKHSLLLFKKINSPKKVVLIKNTGHNNLPDYANIVIEFIKTQNVCEN